jgi:hypothetical protein
MRQVERLPVALEPGAAAAYAEGGWPPARVETPPGFGKLSIKSGPG